MVMAALVICAVLISGCRAKTPAKYGREHNDKRKKRLIPIIPDDWHWFGRLDTWESSQDIAQTVPHYASKYMTYDEQGLHAESDCYYSGKTYPEPDSDSGPGAKRRERLDITYDYDAEEEGRYPWTFHIDSGEHSKPPGTLEEAEALLKSWGIERLNYPRPKD
jgi:hypothetical protein